MLILESTERHYHFFKIKKSIKEILLIFSIFILETILKKESILISLRK